MQRVPVAAERTDREAALLDGAQERLLLCAVSERHVGIAVARARVVAGTELDSFDPQRGHAVEHLLEREIREEDGEDAELHGRDRIRLAASREA